MSQENTQPDPEAIPKAQRRQHTAEFKRRQELPLVEICTNCIVFKPPRLPVRRESGFRTQPV